MKTLLYIVRHGHSTGNETKTFYGHFDGVLTETGHSQAKYVADFFADKRVDAVYSSDLIRCVGTVKPTALSKGLEVIGDKRLREIYAGDWENRHIDDLMAEYAEEYRVWREEKSESRCTNGESVRELQSRVYEAVCEIAQNNPGKSVVIGTHATPIMVLKPAFVGEKIETINGKQYVPNASITVVSYEDGKWEMLSYGESEHLGSLVTTLAKGF